MCRDGLQLDFLLLHQEKAFDKYLMGTLWTFSFRACFMEYLQVLYASKECLVELNWVLTETESSLIEWYVRAALCPAISSPLLSSPSSISSVRGRGVGTPGSVLVRGPIGICRQCASCVQGPGRPGIGGVCQAIYSEASSAWISWIKRSGLLVKNGWQVDSLPPMLCAIR